MALHSCEEPAYQIEVFLSVINMPTFNIDVFWEKPVDIYQFEQLNLSRFQT